MSLEYRWDWAENDYLLSNKPSSTDVVMMRPKDFLNIAADVMGWSDENVEHLMAKMKRGQTLDLPFLTMADNAPPTISDIGAEPTVGCRVTGHEGRHRAEAARRLGIERIPVIIFYEEYYQDIEDRRRLRDKDKDKQNCLRCDDDVCLGAIEKESWMEWKDRGTTLHGGVEHEVEAYPVEVDWMVLPSVRNATSAWRRQHGVEL